MLHRIVSRSVVALAATAFLASCEDNTTGTPLPPPTPSTAVYVSAVEPAEPYTVVDQAITLPDGSVEILPTVQPELVFQVLNPDGTIPVGQTITFTVNLPGFVENQTAVVDANGFVSPGYWVVGSPCETPYPSVGEVPFCRPLQRVIAAPVAGDAAYIDVQTAPPEEEEEEED